MDYVFEAKNFSQYVKLKDVCRDLRKRLDSGLVHESSSHLAVLNPIRRSDGDYAWEVYSIEGSIITVEYQGMKFDEWYANGIRKDIEAMKGLEKLVVKMNRNTPSVESSILQLFESYQNSL
jgi:hypothetical protein